jgi:DNA-binding IclR family transcriptional regulator
MTTTLMAPEIVDEITSERNIAQPSRMATGKQRTSNSDTSAGKALALLDAFSGQFTVLGVTALADRVKIPKSTAYRLLNVLIECGYVRRVGDRYCLTEHLFEVGNQVRSCRPSGIRELAMPYLGDLFAQTHQTVHLAVLSGTDVLYLDKISGSDAARCPTSVGCRRPAYATALGKALLAFGESEDLDRNLRVPFRRFTPHTMITAMQVQRSVERIRDAGIATDHEELHRGVNCIAAPILDLRSGRALAAISICSVNSSAGKRHSLLLLRTADELSRHRTLAM